MKSKERPSAGKGTRRQSPVLRLGDEAIPPELRHLRNHPAFELAYRFPKEGLKHFERLRCEQSLLAFFERAWREFDPAAVKINWHHEAICEHLMAVTRGEIRRLIINVPPRASKSNLVNIIWPAWTWVQKPREAWLSGPQIKFMCISYGQKLSSEIATLARHLVLSEWYQGNWGEKTKLYDDQSRIDNFGNISGGVRIATSMTGSTLGRGGDIRIIDDAQNVEDANSPIETDRVVRTYRESLQTRETDPQTSAEVIIMQRLNENDLTGYILSEASDDVVHLVYPMRHDPTRHCTTRWFDDPRTEDQELLWPAQFPEEVVADRERRMGPFAVAGQYQQAPEPRGGGIFKRDWFQAWPVVDEYGEVPAGSIINGRIIYPALEYIVASVDTAHTAKEENDYCAMIILGVFRAEGKGRIERQADGQYIRIADDQGYPKVLLLHGWMKRLTIHGPPEELPAGIDLKLWNSASYLPERQKTWGLVEWVHHSCRRYKVDHLIIETQAAGHALDAELHRLHSDSTWSVELSPARGDKVARGYKVQGMFSSHQFYAPTYQDGTYPTWCEPIIDQLCVFPKGRHDDAVDACTQALAHLRDIGIFERRGEYEIAEEQSRIWIPGQQRLELPYDL